MMSIFEGAVLELGSRRIVALSREVPVWGVDFQTDKGAPICGFGVKAEVRGILLRFLVRSPALPDHLQAFAWQTSS